MLVAAAAVVVACEPR